MCLFPKLINNPKYRVTKKNGGQVPPLKDGRVSKVPIGCGYCIECMKQKKNEWSIRLAEDLKVNTEASFITLTFSSEAFKFISEEVQKKSKEKIEGYALDNEVATYATRRFLERWRRKYKKSVRHWLITELGGKGTENVHLHGVIFSKNTDEIERIWNNGTIPYGFVWKGKKKGGKTINYVSDRTVSYIMKYVTKTDSIHPSYKPKILCSKGIGKNYINDWSKKKHEFKGADTEITYRTQNGRKMALPIYYRNLLFSEEEREQLWINRLDKEEMWIGGDKVDANDTESINELLQYHQRKNAEMGYGGPWNWKTQEYELQRRNLLHMKRMKKLEEKELKGKNMYANCYGEKGTRGPEESKVRQNGLKQATRDNGKFNAIPKLNYREILKEMGVDFNNITEF